jgi:hypothetical protein
MCSYDEVRRIEICELVERRYCVVWCKLDELDGVVRLLVIQIADSFRVECCVLLLLFFRFWIDSLRDVFSFLADILLWRLFLVPWFEEFCTFLGQSDRTWPISPHDQHLGNFSFHEIVSSYSCNFLEILLRVLASCWAFCVSVLVSPVGYAGYARGCSWNRHLWQYSKYPQLYGQL